MAYLNKTAKKYNLDLTQVIDGVNGYKEDVNGSIGGVSYTCDNGDYGYVIFDWLTSYTASFQQRYVRFEFKQFHYVSSIGEWTIKKPNLFQGGNVSKVDDSGYVNESGVVVSEADAFEQVAIPDTDPVQYNSVLKAGYKTEYQYWFDTIGMNIINAAQQSIISRLV